MKATGEDRLGEEITDLEFLLVTHEKLLLLKEYLRHLSLLCDLCL